MNKITVLLADDHAVFREGLRLLLQTAGDMEVIGEAADGQSAIREAGRLQPDVILMDIAMPLLNGVEATRIIVREVPLARVLILSSYSDEQHLRKAVEAGAGGFLMKEDAANDVLAAIREVALGNAVFSAGVARFLLEARQNGHLCSPLTGRLTLTSRQTEVLQLIAEGHSSKQIAGLLSLSIKTVEKHRQSMMKRLGIHEIASLTRYAISSGLMECAVALGDPAIAAARKPDETR